MKPHAGGTARRSGRVQGGSGRSLRPGTLFAAMLASAAPLGAEDLFQTEVFKGGSEGYHTFRIPALTVTAKGTLLAFAEGRKTSAKDSGDIDLVLKRSADGGTTWGGLELVHEEGGTKAVTIGNPCPVVDGESGTIWLPFCRDNAEVLVTSSADDGKTWSAPRDITAAVKKPDWGWYATGPGVGIQLRGGAHKGRLVIPCDHRLKDDGGVGEDGPEMYSHVFFSDDHGATWKLGGASGPYMNECQAVELDDGRLLLNMRNYWGRAGKRPERGGMRAIAWSRDGGESWSEVDFDKALVEPVCQASLIRYPSASDPGKSLILFSNPSSSTKRIQMTVRLSHDGGKTWPAARELHSGPAAYSSLAALPDRRIGCLYEGGDKEYRQSIRFARFTLGWLTGGNDAPVK